MRPIINKGTIDNILYYAQTMAGFASERALTKNWSEHPMFGICVDNDEKAKSFQETKNYLIEFLKEEGLK